MARTYTIRVDQDVYRELEGRIQGFGDRPNSVLRRLLGLEPARDLRVAEAAVAYSASPWRLSGFRRGRPPSPERRQARQDEFTRPLLEALARRGGEARARIVLDEVGELLKDTLTALDLEPMSNGEPRWRVTAAFERKNLVDRGLLDEDAPRGIWRLSEAGRRWLEESAETPPSQQWDIQAGLQVIDRVMRENKQWLREMASR